MPEKPYINEPRTPEELKDYGDHIVQYSPDYSLCAGCESCTIMCGLIHDGCTGHNNGRIRVDLGTVDMIHRVLSCQQCNDHPCYEACPRKDEAMCIDPSTGIVYIEEEKCIGCGLCQKNCKFTPSRIGIKKAKVRKEWKAVKCDLCRGREGGPACIEWCPVKCIGLSSQSTLTPDTAAPAENKGGEA